MAFEDTDQRSRKLLDHRSAVEAVVCPAALVYHKDDRNDPAVVSRTYSLRMIGCNSAMEVELRQLRPLQPLQLWKMSAAGELGVVVVAAKEAD